MKSNQIIKKGLLVASFLLVLVSCSKDQVGEDNVSSDNTTSIDDTTSIEYNSATKILANDLLNDEKLVKTEAVFAFLKMKTAELNKDTSEEEKKTYVKNIARSFSDYDAKLLSKTLKSNEKLAQRLLDESEVFYETKLYLNTVSSLNIEDETSLNNYMQESKEFNNQLEKATMNLYSQYNTVNGTAAKIDWECVPKFMACVFNNSVLAALSSNLCRSLNNTQYIDMTDYNQSVCRSIVVSVVGFVNLVNCTNNFVFCSRNGFQG